MSRNGNMSGREFNKQIERPLCCCAVQSDEVKTFKKLRLGAEPVSVMMGLVVVDNTNSATWAAHVKRGNEALKCVLPFCLVISIACILGVGSLAGLGSAPMPVLGSPVP
jgi:hypothetical protein